MSGLSARSQHAPCLHRPWAAVVVAQQLFLVLLCLGKADGMMREVASSRETTGIIDTLFNTGKQYSALCVIAKNENRYLREWLHYHQCLGRYRQCS